MFTEGMIPKIDGIDVIEIGDEHWAFDRQAMLDAFGYKPLSTKRMGVETATEVASFNENWRTLFGWMSVRAPFRNIIVIDEPIPTGKLLVFWYKIKRTIQFIKEETDRLMAEIYGEQPHA